MKSALENANAYVGKVINNITILEVYQNPKQKVRATYKCSCGRITKDKDFGKLKRGKIQQCKICAATKNSNSPKKAASLRANAKYDYLVGQTINYFTVLRWATREETKYTGRFVCQCACGNIRFISGNELINTKDRKSCGCLSQHLQSIANGGTGVPYENAAINRALRDIPEYTKWVKLCLEKAKYTCKVSGLVGGHLAVHHTQPLSQIIKLNNITIGNYKDYLSELFNINNGIVLQKTIHTKLHQTYGNEVSLKDILEYRDTYYPTK